jgi:hypothetical protein
MVQSIHLSIPLFVLATICRLVEDLSWLTSIVVFFLSPATLIGGMGALTIYMCYSNHP